MSLWLPALVALVLVAAWLGSRTEADPMALSDRAAATGDFGPLLTTLHRVPAADQPTVYHRVLRRLWDAYHRDAAVTVAKDLARHHRDAPVAQYWLHRFLQHEPEIAAEHLDEDFLGSFYDPVAASKCGSFG